MLHEHDRPPVPQGTTDYIYTPNQHYFCGERIGARGGLPVVGHFVHEGVAHGGSGFVVNAILSLSGEEIFFFDFIGPDALGDTNHPEELRLVEDE